MTNQERREIARMVMGMRMISIWIVVIAILAAGPLAADASTTTATAWRSAGARDLAPAPLYRSLQTNYLGQS